MTRMIIENAPLLTEPSNPKSASPGYRLRPLVRVAVFLTSLLVFVISLFQPGMNPNVHASVHDMIHGTAYAPFVHRVLPSLIIRSTLACIPEAALTRADQWGMRQPKIRWLLEAIRFDVNYPVEALLVLSLTYLSLLGFLWASRYLCTGIYRTALAVQDLFVLAVLAGLPLFFSYCNYLYDFPALCLFTLGLALLIRRRWRRFLVVYLLAALNKETTILLTLVFVLHYWRAPALPRRRFWAVLLAQLVLFGAVKGALMLVFRDHPGTPIEWHLLDHNYDILSSYSLTALFGWCGVILLTCTHWPAKPVFLRRALWIAPILVGLTLFCGYLDELRDYYEAYPIVALLLLHSVSRIWKFELECLEPPETRVAAT